MPKRKSKELNIYLQPPKEPQIETHVYFPISLDAQLEEERLLRRSKQHNKHPCQRQRISKSQIINEAVRLYFALDPQDRRKLLGETEDEDL